MRIAGGDRPIDDQPARGNAAAIVGVAILLSGAAHAALLTWALLARAPHPFSPEPAHTITVDLVAPDEIAEQKAPEIPIAEITPPESSAQPAAPAPPPAPSDLRGTEEPLMPQRPAPPAAASAPTPPPPTPEPVATATPPRPQPPPPAAAQSVEPPTAAPPVSTFGLEAMLGDPSPMGGEGPRADQDAQLSQESVAAFREQLKKCWKPPAGVDPSTKMKMVLRVYLTPSGAITREPVLLQASAAPEGPAVVQAAMRAMRQCQPYKALPADRYNEWKVLDVTLSPRELAGG